MMMIGPTLARIQKMAVQLGIKNLFSKTTTVTPIYRFLLVKGWQKWLRFDQFLKSVI